VAATDADAALEGGREDSHPALAAASTSKTAVTGIRIRGRDFTSIPPS
jgi:hypothetical protein